MQPGQTVSQQTCNIPMGIDGVLADCSPYWVLVHGDTSTTFDTSLVAYYKQVGVTHVEASLRTHNIYSPWPEEGNRQITGRLAGLHCAPREESISNLVNEGVLSETIHVTGNTVIDALLSGSQRVASDQELCATLAAWFPFLVHAKRLVLVTDHPARKFRDWLRIHLPRT